MNAELCSFSVYDCSAKKEGSGRIGVSLCQRLLQRLPVLTRVHVGDRFQHDRTVARQHLQLVLQYDVLEVGQRILHLPHVIVEILHRLGRFVGGALAAAIAGRICATTASAAPWTVG